MLTIRPIYDLASFARVRAREAGLCLGLACASVGCAEPDMTLESQEQALNAREEDCAAYAVGTQRIEVSAGQGRVLPVQLWYPAVESARSEARRGRPLSEIEPVGSSQRALLEQLLASAPTPGTSHRMHAANAPRPLRQRALFPLVVFSHCTECLRFSTLSIAEHLASLGFVVAAPDHPRNTLYDRLQGTSVGLDLPGFLPVRVADMKAVLDTLLDPRAQAVPTGLRGQLDGARVGAFGHSFGGITTGLVVQQDARVRAGVALAVHIAIPLGMEALYPPGLQLAELSSMTKPFMFLAAAEDVPLFNLSIEDNFQRYPVEAWHVVVRDTAHYSFTDICGLVPELDLGSCSPAPRQTDPSVTYEPLPIERSRELAKQYVATFFQRELLGRGKGPSSVATGADATLEHHR